MIRVEAPLFVAIAVLAIGCNSRDRGATPLANHQSGRVIGWIGLYSDSLIAWLENANHLDSLCPVQEDRSEMERCRLKHLAAKEGVYALRNRSADDADEAGSLRVVATPGSGLQAFYVPMSGGPLSFTPDLFDADWGYGPYFHQTIVSQNKAWFELPSNPFPPGTWLDTRQLRADADVRALTAGDIVTSPKGDLFVLSADSGVLVARAEQRADMWCQIDPAPAVEPAPEIRLTPAELYDASGHLFLKIKYTRGC